MAELDEEFRKKFPNLTKEFSGPGTVKIDAARSSAEEADKVAHDRGGYEPTAIDFIRRCKTDSQALDVIDFLEKKGDITRDYAKRLRSQIAVSGLGSFGKHREPGCYERGEIY